MTIISPMMFCLLLLLFVSVTAGNIVNPDELKDGDEELTSFMQTLVDHDKDRLHRGLASETVMMAKTNLDKFKKFGLVKAMPAVKHVSLKKTDHLMFQVDKPEVYEFNEPNSYLIFGTFKSDFFEDFDNTSHQKEDGDGRKSEKTYMERAKEKGIDMDMFHKIIIKFWDNMLSGVKEIVITKEDGEVIKIVDPDVQSSKEEKAMVINYPAGLGNGKGNTNNQKDKNGKN
jgi:hypothetical protein